ncbi:MAG: cytochrome c nitrite reductase small subunit [Phycisphaeraceae bacterium]|nr:cytochrome c nitrite reductase small subunit [Phycisphaeraceae bacterium]
MRRFGPVGALIFGVCFMTGLLGGVGGYTFYYAQGFSYMSDDPAVCVNCHIMRPQYDGWQKASHHAVATCNDCHVPHDFVGKWMTKATNGYHHSTAFTFQNFHEPIRIKPSNSAVLEANCLRCHGDLVGNITQHFELKSGDLFGCVRCHAGVGHGPPK